MSELYTAPPSPNPDYNNLIKLWKRMNHTVPRAKLEELRIMSEESPGKFKEYYNQWVYANDTYGGRSKAQDIDLNFDKISAQYEYNRDRQEKGLDPLNIRSLDWAPGRYDDAGNEALNAWYQENGYMPKGMQVYDFTEFKDEYARKKADRAAQAKAPSKDDLMRKRLYFPDGSEAKKEEADIVKQQKPSKEEQFWINNDPRFREQYIKTNMLNPALKDYVFSLVLEDFVVSPEKYVQAIPDEPEAEKEEATDSGADAQPEQQPMQGTTDYEAGTNTETVENTVPAFYISPDGTKSVSSKVKGGNYVITPVKSNLYVLQYVDGNGQAHATQAYFGTYDGAQRAVSQIAPLYLKDTLSMEQLKKIAKDINLSEAAAGSPRAFIPGYDDADSFDGIDVEGDKFYNPYTEKDGLVYSTAQGITNLLNWGDKAWRELTGAGDNIKMLSGKLTPEEAAERNRKVQARLAAYIAKYGHLGPDAADTESTFVTSVSPEYAAMAGFADMGQGALFRPLEELVNAKADASGSDTRLMNGAEALNRVHGAYPIETAIGTTAFSLIPIGTGEKAAAVTLAKTAKLGAKAPAIMKMFRAGAPLGIYNGLKSVGEGNSADAVALNIVEGILAGAQIEGGMQILESLAATYLPKAGAALYEKWLAGGRKASVFSREAKEAMIKGLSGELRLAGKEYETVWGGVKDPTPVNNRSLPNKTAALETPKTIPTMAVDGKPATDLQQSVLTNGNTPNLGDDIILSAKEGNPGAKVEDIIEPNGGKTPGAAGDKVPKDAGDAWYKADGTVNLPPNYGAVKGTEKIIDLQPGSKLGRFGKYGKSSDFVTAPGSAAETLSLPPYTDTSIYQEFTVLKPIPGVTQSTVAPWGGLVGGGIQYRLPMTIEDLLLNGYICK